MDTILRILDIDFEKVLIRLAIRNGSSEFSNETNNDYLPSDPYPFFLIIQRVRDYSRLLELKLNHLVAWMKRIPLVMDDIPTHPRYENDPSMMPQDIDIEFKNFDPMCYDPIPLD